MTKPRKDSKMTEILNACLRALEAAVAQGLTGQEARRAAEVSVRAEFGGERIYVPSLPKQARAVQLARLNLQTTRAMSVASGLPLRTVQRLRSGR